MVRHSARVDRVEAQVRLVRFDSHGHPCRRLLRRLHAQEELELYPHFIQQVVDAVIRLGYERARIGEGVRFPQYLLPLMNIEKGPDGYAGVDDVLAVIARVVPAAGNIECVVAARPLVSVTVGARAAGGCLLRMARRPRPLRSGEFRLDGDVAAVVIEVPERVELEFAIRSAPDVERVTRCASALNAELLTLTAPVAEVDKVHVFAGMDIVSEYLCLTSQSNLVRPVDQAPLDRRSRPGQNDRTFRSIGIEAGLVEVYSHAGIFASRT